MNGTIELKTERLVLRRHTADDAEKLYELFGKDNKMHEYTGWNPYIRYDFNEICVKKQHDLNIV